MLGWYPSSLHIKDVLKQKPESIEFDIQLITSKEDRGLEYAELRKIHPSLHKSTDRGNISPVSSSQPLEKSVSIIQEWVNRCRMEHSACNSVAKYFPRRTLYLQDDQTAYVVDHGSNRITMPYACLSHRWSDQTKAVSITEKTMAMYTNPFDIQKLPQLFQDAVAITLSLGLKHIWIDCLCIFQDDTKDWEIEASAMALIYENAEFTIAASSCEGCEESLFQQRPLQHSTQITTWKGNPVILRPKITHPWDISGTRTTKNGFPLLSRGWVFQERRLSRRYIHFGRNELLFECRECVWCECQSQSAYNSYLSPQHPLSQRHQDWKGLIRSYQKQKFTYEIDRLPALAGVAKHHHRLWGGTYIAGHWYERMNETLAWYCWNNEGIEQTARQKKTRVPTWSWIYTGREVHWATYLTQEIQLIGFHQDQLEDPYVTARSATITIYGSLVKATVHHGNDLRALKKGRWKDPFLNSSQTCGVQVNDLDIGFPIYPDHDFGDTSSTPVPSSSPVMLLLCASGLERKFTMGIILRQVDDVGKRYERIGFWEYTWPRRKKEVYWRKMQGISTKQTITLV